jgi:hypothetical protein
MKSMISKYAGLAVLEAAAAVRDCVAEVMEFADSDILELVRSRAYRWLFRGAPSAGSIGYAG